MTGAAGESEEGRLWVAAVGGDGDAFAAVFDLHVERVHRQALRFSLTVQDAEDVTAMVFLEAWRLRHRVRVVDSSVRGWLLVTAAHIARNGYRARRRHDRVLRGIRPEHASDPADEVAAAEQRAHARGRVGPAFAGLSARDQEILALCVIEEVRPADAAVLLRISAGTARTRLSRAKERLRMSIEERGQGTGWETIR
jgi:RNA polymerase sigma factor (sigma-70 family)